MSKPIMHEDGKHVIDRNGEFFNVRSTYSLAHDPGMRRTPWNKLMVDVDELQNKPRRFFDTLLSIIETQRDIDPLLDSGNRREYWDYLVKGCEMWLSAVENGLYMHVERLAEPKSEADKYREE